MKKKLSIILALFLSIFIVGCSDMEVSTTEDLVRQEADIQEDEHYTSKEEVALYIKTYDKLPDNYITKEEARDLGWDPKKANLWDLTDEKSIGGDLFGNREGLLPEKEGRKYREADIDYDGEYRGAKRLVYSNDGLIYYTKDHYETFELLYGDEDQ